MDKDFLKDTADIFVSEENLGNNQLYEYEFTSESSEDSSDNESEIKSKS